MSTAVCPSCGKPLPQGSLACTNPKCVAAGKGVVERALSPAVAPGRGHSGVRPSGSRPELLDRLPTNFFASPAMFAVGGAVAFLYGLVLFSVVSSAKARQEAMAAEEARQDTRLASAFPVAPPLPPEPPKQAGPSAPTGKPVEPPKAPADAPDAPPEPKTKRTQSRRGEAAKTPERPPSPTLPPPPEEPRVGSWGVLAGDPGDCQFRPEGANLNVLIPGTLHVLSTELKQTNSPRLLTPVQGDFVAEVSVLGRILPGTVPLPKFPFAFQGAGLLLWQDENNYLRLERSAMYTIDRTRLHQVLVEYCRDGKTSTPTVRDVREAALTLRFDRRGPEVRCQYSPDGGKTWLEVKRQTVALPASGVKVGVSASNASPKPFTASFAAFELTGGANAR